MTQSAIERLIDVMARLRDPERGCPWDIEQNFETIAPYTIEEAYEVADAIASGDKAVLLGELGDLLFQVVYYAQMSREVGGFDFDAIARAAADKMIRRHPHVFGDQEVDDSDAQTRAWEAHKATERTQRSGAGDGAARALAGVARALPALVRAHKLAKRAARVGFDWPTTAAVITKIEEELGEVSREIAAGAPTARVKDEIGDLLFAVANLARKLDIDPEAALRDTNDKFTRRFAHVEDRLAQRGITPQQTELHEMDALWNEAKAAERKASPSSKGG
ncbi:MAG: nucleoside triphosphate pyrophosphohydrolase [Alphaproteobacteria bacterium]|nr:nucleoside triphosphate pyrophosphohydrolase [Alphaproteobacteria bacterium]